MYAYNTQVHRATGFAQFELPLFNSLQLLAVRPTVQDRQAIMAMQYFHWWQQSLAQLMQEAGKKMSKAQQKYK